MKTQDAVNAGNAIKRTNATGAPSGMNSAVGTGARIQRRRVTFALAGTALAGILGPGSARAEYRELAIKLVIPYPPGTGTDVLARFIGRKLEERLGKPVVPEQRVGSSGMIAAQAVIGAPADGHTLFFVANAPVATNVALFQKLAYDPVKDLAPVARLALGSFGLLVPAASKYRTAQELMAAAAANPSKLSYGAGSATYQIATEWLLSLASARANHVPYKGAAPVLTDLAGGHIDFALAEYGGAQPFIRSGKLRLLAVTADRRLAAEPNVPTMIESGYPDYAPVAWWAVFVAARVPQPVIDRLERALLDIMATDEAQQFLARNNLVAFPADAKTLRRYQLDDIERETRVIEAAKIPRQ